MPAAIALISGVIIFAVFLIGVVRALFVLVPFHAYVGVSMFLIWRSARRHAEQAAALQREARRQRFFNDQEMQAWIASIEKDERSLQRVHLVRVMADSGEHQIWLAATGRREAVDRVLDSIPKGWSASLAQRELGTNEAAALDLMPGEVRQHRVA